MNDTSQRLIYLDILRVIATIGVIAIHVYGTDYSELYNTFDWHVANVGDSLVRWSVPIFVMISGVLFLSPQRDVSLREILTKYVPRLLGAYLFWTVVYDCLRVGDRYYLTGIFSISVWDFFPHFHLWFLPMLMGVYLLTPILRKVSVDKTLLQYSLVLWLIFGGGSFVSSIHPIPAIGNIFCFSKYNVMGYVGYFLFGYRLSQKEFTCKQRTWIYVVGIVGGIVTILGGTVLSWYLGKANEAFLCYLGLHVVTMAMAMFVFVKQMAPRCKSWMLWFEGYVRKDLFGIYLTHAIWLLFINTVGFRDSSNHLITLPLIVIAVFILSLYTTKIIRLIPWLRKFVD